MNLTYPMETIKVSGNFSPDEFPAFHHIPVLLQEVMDALQPAPGKIFLDGTVGGGGHAAALLERGAQVIGLDQDDEALHAAKQRLRCHGDAFHPVKANFRQMKSALNDLQVVKVDGILLDLGVSSHQLDQPKRGFSFQTKGPLEMRMDPSRGQPASALVNYAPIEELVQIFREYGEEPQAARIARAIIKRRGEHLFEDTLDLAGAVEQVVPRRGRRHPATQIFQALRIAVNDELGALKMALQIAPALLNEGGRFAVISFHSLEDRFVKSDFRQRSLEFQDRPEWTAPRTNPACVYRLLSRKSISAGASELAANPRSRSAKLRCVEKRKDVS